MFLRAGLPMVALGLLVGCGETDEEIASLKSQLSALQGQMEENQNAQTELITALQNEIDAINGAVDLTELADTVGQHSVQIEVLETDLNVVRDDYLVASSLDGYATETWVSDQAYGLAVDVSANAASVVVNTATIDGHTSAIATNLATGTANSTAIAVNIGDIASNASAITVNSGGIASNSSELATQSGDIATNTGNIATNTGNIATNTSDIGTNTTDISSISSDVSSNDAAIATNTGNITTNLAAISSNTTDIGSNATDIADNTADISSNTGTIATNTSGIGTLEGAVVSVDTTWDIGPSSTSDYSDLNAAMNAARTMRIQGDAVLTLQLEAGTHSTATTVNLNHPQGANIEIFGNSSNPSSVVYEYTGTGNAFNLHRHSIGRVYGIQLEATSAASGSGFALYDNAWAQLGYMTIDGFGTYGVSIRRQSGIRVQYPTTIRNSGSYAVDVRDSGYFYAPNIVVHDNLYGVVVTTNSTAVLNGSESYNNTYNGYTASYGSYISAYQAESHDNDYYGFSASYDSSISADQSLSEDNVRSGYYAVDSSIRARTASAVNNGGYGYRVSYNSFMDANYSSNSGNVSGEYNVTERASSTDINYNIYR